ncbi:hypothetical protein [Arenicella xantha]|uniref:SxtJ n=1 Tax=Arenicella xantha TaxID=644221 RepID=A0A395JJA6_9GAMM|nr:hypothetical protein [Arenicella xantha]RBP50866.1 hypothetical protein DFR28_102282 [Arenicella xantha]
MPIEHKAAATSPTAKALENRTFGLIFAGIFAVIALIPLINGNSITIWAAILSGLMALSALLLPTLLTPLNTLFQKFGLVMHKITNPIFMGLVFFGTVLPTGLIMRLLGKDPMHRKLDPAADSYWIARETHLVTKDSFDNQF